MRTIRFGYPGDGGLGERLLAAVLAGTKTATSSLAVEYLDGTPLPRVGERLSLVDEVGRPHGTVMTTQVSIAALSAVGDDVAIAEGEGFSDAQAWREAHIAFWHEVTDDIRASSKDPTWVLGEHEPVVVERFVLLPASPASTRSSSGAGSEVVVTSLGDLDAAGLDAEAVVGLYRSVGWSSYTEHREQLLAAIAGSAHVVLAHRGGELVGLARVVSDGVSIAYLQDVLVHPDHQRAGIGAALVTAVMAPFAAVRQQVLLTDDEPAQHAFYEALGFLEAGQHPAGPLRSYVRIQG